MMGPEINSSEYIEQVETIKLRLTDVKDLISQDEIVINKVLMMFVVDRSYSRAAICQAEKEWRHEHA